MSLNSRLRGTRTDMTPPGNCTQTQTSCSDETVSIVDALHNSCRFFAHESCGKCFPCQLGTQRQLEILEQKSISQADKEALLDVGQAMTETSLCGLGQTASSAVVSAIRLWPELIE